MTDRLIEVPLAKLVPSSRNVRRTGSGEGIGELAASIEAHGLLQNLAVRPIASGNGKKSQTYEVVAGARRLAALKDLAKCKRLAKGFKVPCRVIREGEEVEASLAENVERAPLHPADEFEAFSKLHAEGQGAEEIAARFGVSPTTVKQRLKLAAVSPRLIDVYRKGEMTLDQLMAFTVTDDHEAQEEFWFGAIIYDRAPPNIRRLLTKSLVSGHDRRARFVGAEAYEVAGGTIVRDLFDAESGGYFADSSLLDRLVSEKLASAAEAVKAEGWAWVEALPEMDYVLLAKMGRAHASEEPLSEEVQAKVDALSAEYDALVEEHGEEPPEEILANLERLSAEIDTLSVVRLSWSEEDKSRAGAIVTIDPAGALSVDRGLVKPVPRGTESERDSEHSDSAEPSPEPRERNPHSEALLEELSAHRTAALQETLAGNPVVAFAALVHTLVVRTFFGDRRETCIDVRLVIADVRPSAGGTGGSPAVAAMVERHRHWSERLPAEPELWDWIWLQDRKTLLELLAYCVARTANALVRRFDPGKAERLRDADRLASAVELDMTRWWKPTRESYLSRVPKSQILAAVSEAVTLQAAENIAGMKKEAMAVRAEELLEGKGWLPEPLRTLKSESGPAASD